MTTTRDIPNSPLLQRLGSTAPHAFEKPSKRIYDHQDVSTFLTSLAYRDIMTFILQLNRSMVPTKTIENGSPKIQTWPLGSCAIRFSEPVRQLQLLLTKLEAIIIEVPPDTGPRRFGNISFRKWFEEMELRASSMLDECLPPDVLLRGAQTPDSVTAKVELMAYLTGGFGSPQRLDYGTGHELSFLAFLACLWKLNAFSASDSGAEERAIVVGVIEPYLKLIRRLIIAYTLEPAGSHGVWGLDDHSFIPYILGSAQLAPACSPLQKTPIEGSLEDAPALSSTAKPNVVERERKANMYFAAIGFINDVKKGPFWEHSPMLFDISGIKDGWGKINKGMIKMYNAEVLSKFPVVQHFPFGSLFRWEQDPNAASPLMPAQSSSCHSQPKNTAAPTVSDSRSAVDAGTKAPWASMGPPQTSNSATGRGLSSYGVLRTPSAPTQPPCVSQSVENSTSNPLPPAQAPWAVATPPESGYNPNSATTKAPWAK
ncbi:Serine/threonine-protein phosphatase 2A activator 1 [Ophidiomyces ophidiicola]|nr:Serine/threonine-protein phosphatase 2A activator 1 [Ophidiomyces ophidiicola]